MALKCPNCSGGMQEVQKHGVHIDYCPTCKGIWLDRGEIDKVIQSAGAPSANIVAPSHDSDLGQIFQSYEKKGGSASLRRNAGIKCHPILIQ